MNSIHRSILARSLMMAGAASLAFTYGLTDAGRELLTGNEQ
jgi:hypothetical protein